MSCGSIVQPLAVETDPSLSGQIVGATRNPDSVGTPTNNHRTSAPSSYRSNRSKSSTHRTNPDTVPPYYSRTSPVAVSHQSSSSSSKISNASAGGTSSASSYPGRSSSRQPPHPSPSPPALIGTDHQPETPYTQPEATPDTDPVPPESPTSAKHREGVQDVVDTMSRRSEVYFCPPSELLNRLVL